MNSSKKPSIFANICPNCGVGKVFKFFLFIERQCSNCGFEFEKEEGYFFGPMIISYFTTSLLALPVMLYLVFKEQMEFPQALGVGIAMIVLLGPIVYRYSKLVWLHAETKFDSAMKAEQRRAEEIKKSREGG